MRRPSPLTKPSQSIKKQPGNSLALTILNSMNDKLFQHPFLKGFQFFLVFLLVLGIYFRFVNLDRKVYWLDETHTSLRISGYTEPEFIQEIFAGNLVTSV